MYAKTDYAINAGNAGTDYTAGAVPGLTVCFTNPNIENPCKMFVRAALKRIGDVGYNGASGPLAEQQFRVITDGTAFTMLCGEKSVPIEFYNQGDGDPADGVSGNGGFQSNDGDNSSMYLGWDHDTARHAGSGPVRDPEISSTSKFPPAPQDQPQEFRLFGSAHAAGVNMAFMDGSVHSFSYDVDKVMWGRLFSGNDGQHVEIPD
jgi:prepilin-type processing-associated H-X9-DG protein